MFSEDGHVSNLAPRLSVVIPTYNRAAKLRATLDALARQSHAPDDYEVVVVVDGSSDTTIQLLGQIETPYALTVLSQPNRGPAAARNLGISYARGRYCLFIDDDIVAERDLIAEHVKLQTQWEARGGVVGLGHVETRLSPRADAFARACAERWRAHFRRLVDGRQLSFADVWSGNVSVPREALLRVGGFDAGLRRGEDVEVGFRLQRAGLGVAYVPSAIAHHVYDKRFEAIVADAEADGEAGFEISRRHPGAMGRLVIGNFHAPGLRSAMLRRLLLEFSVPPRALRTLGETVRGVDLRERWFDFLYRFCYWRGVRRACPDRDTWKRLTRGPVVLMYHAIGGRGEPATRFVTPARRFASQMRWLRRLGFRVLPLREFIRLRERHELAPPNSVIITLDDGYVDSVTLAEPILSRMGFSAAAFLVTGQMGGTNRWDKTGALAGRAILSWKSARALPDRRWDVGAHSRRHHDLRSLSDEHLWEEVAGSRRDLEATLGLAVDAFAYPFGERTPRVMAAVEQAGFRCAFGIQPGPNDPGTPSFDLRRVEVFGTDSLVRFVMAAAFGLGR